MCSIKVFSSRHPAESGDEGRVAGAVQAVRLGDSRPDEVKVLMGMGGGL